tara:strand:- start:5191 stop:5568 length:378 start_codon:yes stop_codon:yes gene_type:complete
MSKLNKNDYITILNFYKIEIPKTKKGRVSYSKTKRLAEDILANKLCRCIKKVDKSTKNTNKKQKLKNETQAIGICADSVIKRKNLKYNRFECNKKYRFITGKNRQRLMKTANKVISNKTRKNRKL